MGGYDYTPALLPALEWLVEGQANSATEPRRLVIACAGLQSARRLIETTLPTIQRSLRLSCLSRTLPSGVDISALIAGLDLLCVVPVAN